MYQYQKPKPLVIKLTDEWGYNLREKAARRIKERPNITGAERGSPEEQGFGALAENVIRSRLKMPDINSDEHAVSYDILLPFKIKLDVKCRGGTLPFQEEYLSSDGLPREAKHNFFARQIFDKALDTDVYLMTHLETPSNRMLPGTKRQRKWTLYVCGWVSKKRVAREGVYLPRGSLTEQGRTWFTYRGEEIEFYNKNLNGLTDLADLLKIERVDVEKDEIRRGDLNITSVDAVRIAYDLVGRGILREIHVDFVKSKTGITQAVKPILHPNQYFHLLKWLKENGKITEEEYQKAKDGLSEEPFTGI
ncbi:hypothetical protein FJZ40_04940 [Candidatus Shapirobacteria bacterium]|nr:hypothetical protein [Candidatus Shapirobacteria bacterium]